MAFYEEMNPADITVEEILPFVTQFLPQMDLESIVFFYHGTYNVFDINDEYILRVSDKAFRNIEGLEMLNQEASVLDFFQDKFAIQVPKILHLHQNSSVPFSIHKKIVGKSLVYVIPELNKSQKINIGKTIGAFLSQLHSFEIKGEFAIKFGKSLKLKNDEEFMKSFKLFWNSVFQEAEKIAYKYLTKEEKKWLTNIFNEYLSNEDNFVFTPRISHCDFDTSNILINPITSNITGVIDFENCKVWDPAVDLLFFDEEPVFLETILDNYDNAKEKNLAERMKFFYCRTCVDYLVWGTKHNRQGMIDEGLRRIRKNMNTFPE